MTELKRTPLRHRLLQEIFEGDMRIYRGIHENLVRTSSAAGDRFMTGAEKRTELDIKPLLETRSRSGWSRARLNADGLALLKSWNTRYGTPDTSAALTPKEK